jgi:hypothetical protein
VNDAAQAYEGVIPADRWHDPYMLRAELRAAIDSGVEFWGYEQDGELVGVMGIQPIRDITLIRHAYGEFGVKSGPARRIAEYFCSIVEAVTSRPVGTEDCVTSVQCRRMPGHRRCWGRILAEYREADRTTIVWLCPVCDDNGAIGGWQETLWDKRKLY